MLFDQYLILMGIMMVLTAAAIILHYETIIREQNKAYNRGFNQAKREESIRKEAEDERIARLMEKIQHKPGDPFVGCDQPIKNLFEEEDENE